MEYVEEKPAGFVIIILERGSETSIHRLPGLKLTRAARDASGIQLLARG